jgi:amidase
MKRGEHMKNNSHVSTAIAFTTVFNVTGSPVVVIPLGLTEEGLPIGIQVVGRRWHDMELLSVAEKLAEVAGPMQHPSGF